MEVVPVAVSWVVQVRANRVLAMERPHRPCVRGPNRGTVGDDLSLGELCASDSLARSCRNVGQEGKDEEGDGGGYERPATPADTCGDGVHAAHRPAWLSSRAHSVLMRHRPSYRPRFKALPTARPPLPTAEVVRS